MAANNDYKLVIEDDAGHRSVMSLALGEATVGRLAGNTVRLKERNVSRRHARVFVEDSQVYAEDLDSSNGLFVNGSRIEGRHALRQGDALRVGDFSLLLSGGELSARREDTTQRRPKPEAPDPAENAGGQALPLAEFFESESTGVLRPPPAPPRAPSRPAVALAAPARFLVVTTRFAGQEFQINRSEMVLGRVADNDIAIDHRSVSRQHAKVVVQNGRFQIVDLGSANGTLVNHEAYAQTELNHGDLVELGHVGLRFVAPQQIYTPTTDERLAILGRGPKARSRRAQGLLLGTLGVLLVLLLAWALVPRRSQGPVAEAHPAAATRPSPANDANVRPEEPPASRSDTEINNLMQDVRASLQQHQWRRAQALARAVVALEPQHVEANQALHHIEMEVMAQRQYDNAVGAAAQGQWSSAWNTLQDIDHQSALAGQANALIGQVRPALIGEGLASSREKIRAEAWDKASEQLDEVDGLEPGRRDVADLRAQVEDGRRRRADHNAHAHPPGRAPGRAPRRPPTTNHAGPNDEARVAYNDGVAALTAGQLGRAIDDFSRCVLADKSFALCYRALGIAHSKNGNAARAIRYYRLYLKVEPNARDADEVRQILQNSTALQ